MAERLSGAARRTTVRPVGHVRRFRLDHPLDVRLTLLVARHGGGTSRVAADGVWRATRTPLGPATVHVDDRRADPHHPGGEVVVRAWGRGAPWVLHHAP